MSSDFDQGAKRPLRREAGHFGALVSAKQWMGACGRYWSDRIDALERLLRAGGARKPSPPAKGDR